MTKGNFKNYISNNKKTSFCSFLGKNIKNKCRVTKRNVPFVTLLIASIFVCIPLLNKNLDICYDDGIQHIARLMGTYQSIQEHQSFPVIMSNFCNGFGYSWNIFYSPFTAFAPLVFKIFGASFVNCIKLFMFVVVFASGVSAYFFAKEVTKNRKIAVLTGIFYIFAPYRFTDMYARNALAELASFVFLPMVFHGLYGVLKNKPKKEFLLILGSVCLILTHTVIAMYVAILSFLYLLTQVRKLKNRIIVKKLLASLICIITITSFFWAPLLEHKVKTDYEVFKPGRMERTDVLIALKLDFNQLFTTSEKSNMIYEIGLLSIILLFFTPVIIRILKKKYKNTDFYRFYKFSLVMACICIIMTLKIFPFEYLPSILKMLQFSFRLLEFSSFFLAFVISVNFTILMKLYYKLYIYKSHTNSQEANSSIKKYCRSFIKYTSNELKYKNIFVLVILMITSCSFIPYLHYLNDFKEEQLWPAVPVTARTGRVHAGCASFEYLPCKAFENREYIENRCSDLIVLKGNLQIENTQKQGTNFYCKISSVEGDSIVELPYIYYLGYSVTLEQEETIIKLETFETENGFVGVKLPKVENATIKSTYTGTTIMKISSIVSILGIIVAICFFTSTKMLTKQKKYYKINP